MQNGSSTLLPSVHASHGFCGTIRQHAEPHHAWMLAIDAVARATSASEDAVRAFLASRSGRHFGDEVAKTICSGRDLPAAIDGVVERWMELRITPLIETEIGTPQGLPYLTGFVLMQEALLNRPP
jgi:hypothetical protein